jgi:hypothetical protein
MPLSSRQSRLTNIKIALGDPHDPRLPAASLDAAIRALIDDQIKAVRAKDVSGLLAGYAPDVLVFDLVDPLQ